MSILEHYVNDVHYSITSFIVSLNYVANSQVTKMVFYVSQVISCKIFLYYLDMVN